MSELVEFWVKVSLAGVCMALVFGTIAAVFSAVKNRKGE